MNEYIFDEKKEILIKGYTHMEISKKFNVSISFISCIRNGNSPYYRKLTNGTLRDWLKKQYEEENK